MWCSSPPVTVSSLWLFLCQLAQNSTEEIVCGRKSIDSILVLLNTVLPWDWVIYWHLFSVLKMDSEPVGKNQYQTILRFSIQIWGWTDWGSLKCSCLTTWMSMINVFNDPEVTFLKMHSCFGGVNIFKVWSERLKLHEYIRWSWCKLKVGSLSFRWE